MRKSINKDASFLINMMKLEPQDIIKALQSEFPSGETIPVPMSKDDAFFVPGTRDDRCLLVAHTDTVFSGEPVNPGRSGCFIKSHSRGVGIGADDRAGVCGILRLKDLGHSLLFVPEEETGCVGSGYIAKHRSDILENHSFFVQLDRKGGFDLVTYDVGTSEFEEYLEANMPHYNISQGSFSDIVELCPSVGICGVNISIGFYNEHTSSEILDVMAWVRTVDMLRQFLRDKLRPFTYDPYVDNLASLRGDFSHRPYYGGCSSARDDDADSDIDFEKDDYGIEETEDDYLFHCPRCDNSIVVSGFGDEEVECCVCGCEMEGCSMENLISEELRSLRKTQQERSQK